MSSNGRPPWPGESPDVEALRPQNATWEERRNPRGAPMNWRFTTDAARVRLRSLYPPVLAGFYTRHAPPPGRGSDFQHSCLSTHRPQPCWPAPSYMLARPWSKEYGAPRGHPASDRPQCYVLGNLEQAGYRCQKPNVPAEIWNISSKSCPNKMHLPCRSALRI